jgi:hypothetical protein
MSRERTSEWAEEGVRGACPVRPGCPTGTRGAHREREGNDRWACGVLKFQNLA